MKGRDLTGDRFGRLIVLRDSGDRTKKGGIIWRCQCDCGNQHLVPASYLVGGNTRSCGCLGRELSSERGRSRKQQPKICIEPGCTNTIEKGAKGRCGKHAQRVRRYDDPNFVTPEQVRRERNRDAQPKLGRCSRNTYRKSFGLHEHRRVMERLLGRKLTSDEVVHHIDGDKHNNKPENLKVLTRREHIALHRDDLLRGGS